MVYKMVFNNQHTIIESGTAEHYDTNSNLIATSVFGTNLTYVEAFIIHQWCPFCLIAFGLTLAATFFALKTYGSSLREFIGGNNGV